MVEEESYLSNLRHTNTLFLQLPVDVFRDPKIEERRRVKGYQQSLWAHHTLNVLIAHEKQSFVFINSIAWAGVALVECT